MSEYHIVDAIARTPECTTKAVWQWAYGTELRISGVTLPETFELQMCNEGDAETKTAVGQNGVVLIYDEYLETGKDIFCYLFLHDAETDGTTVRKIIIPIKRREPPSDLEPTPVQHDAITEAIGAMQAARRDIESLAEDAHQAIEEAFEEAKESGEFKGDKGDNGDKGEKGDTGEQGPKGDKGDTGATGPQGIQGIQGEKGETGATGEKGDKGDKGDPGDVSLEQYYGVFPTDTASGSVASFADGADDIPMKSVKVAIEPVQDLHGYDNPWPAGGGVNKYDKNSAESGVRLNDDGTTTATPSFWVSNYIPIAAGETLIRSATGSNRQALYDTEKNFISFVSGASVTATIDGFFRFNGAVDIISKDADIMCNSGSTLLPYAPYSNICPISGWTEANVVRTGKNLLNPATYKFNSTTQNGLTYTAQSDGTIHVTGTATATGGPTLTNDLSLPNGTYTYIAETSQGVLCAYRGRYKSSGSTFSLPTTFTVDGTFTVYVDLYCRATGTYNLTIHPQIEIGTASTGLEPYTGNTYSITFPTEAGTVYGGELDVNNGTLTVTHKYYTNAGTGEWGEVTINGNRYYIGGVSSDAKNTSTNGWSNYGIMTDSFTNDGVVVGSNGRINLCGTLHDAFNSIDALKAHMAQTPLQVVYELAEPITYTLTSAEIKSLLGDNNVWADAGDTEVTYRADTKLYIDKKIAEVVNALS